MGDVVPFFIFNVGVIWCFFLIFFLVFDGRYRDLDAIKNVQHNENTEK